eukprot:10661209-Alexandrium_andersonii.AAC.1
MGTDGLRLLAMRLRPRCGKPAQSYLNAWQAYAMRATPVIDQSVASLQIWMHLGRPTHGRETSNIREK